MKLKNVQVTVEDIEAGERCNSGLCPVALALRRELNVPEEDISVTPGVVLVIIKGETHRGTFSRKVSNAINRYDVEGVFSPMSFDIMLEKQVLCR